MAETSKATQFCADGTPFPVEWLFPGDEAMPWVRDDYHFPLLMPPLEVGLQRLTLATRSAAFREVTGADAPPFWHHFLFPQGFMFIPGDIGPRAQVPPEILAFLLKEWGGARGFFVGYCLPRIRELCHGLQGEEAIWPIERLAAAWMEAFSLTQVALAATVGTIMVALRQFLEESFGVEAQRLREELLQGQENSMQASDQALFELARLASRVPELRAALAREEPASLEAVARISGAQPFCAAFEAYQEQFGLRAEFWQLCAPTSQERPEGTLTMIRQFLTGGAVEPARAQRDAAARAASLREETITRLSPAKQVELSRLLEPARDYVSIREDRAHWQLTACGSLRHALLLRGQRLANRGVIDEAEDVFFLTPAEMDESLAGREAPRRHDIGLRKAEHAFWRTKEPPRQVGVIPATGAVSKEVADPRLVKGLGASRGRVTARACVIHDASEGARLLPGQVLVCPTTSPAWTPLFAIAAAVVTDAGGILNHTSITAREYGIPCVVGARGATQRIADGALITVDGTAGTVTFELEPL